MTSDGYIVYALQSACTGRSYIGCTNNSTRRLRQHNGDLCGGAKATAAHRPWAYSVKVEGFHNAKQALSFEWMWKHMRVNGRGMGRRLAQLCALINKKQWTSKSPSADAVPLRIHVYSPLSSSHLVPCPAYITIVTSSDPT